MNKAKIFVFLTAACLFITPFAVGAQDQPAQDSSFYVSADQVVDKNVFKAAESIVIDGQVNGDVFVAGNVVSINGAVSGSVFAAGNSVSIKGPVGGSVFAAGSSVDVASEVKGSIRVAGSNVTVGGKAMQNISVIGSNIAISRDSSTGWDLLVAGANASASGTVARDAKFDVANLALNSQIGGNADATISGDGKMSLGNEAKISGRLDYRSPRKEQLNLDEGAAVLGEVSWQEQKVDDAKKPAGISYNPFFSPFKMLSFFSLLIIGLVFISLIKQPTKRVAEKMTSEPLLSIGWGVVLFVLIPFISFVLLFTIIGIPLSVLIMIAYFICLYAAKMFAALSIGSYLLGQLNKKKEPTMVLSLIVGLVALFLLIALPFVGWLIKLIVLWWGLGAIFMIKREIIKKINEQP